MARPTHTYAATVLDVIHAGSLTLDVDLGWHIRHRIIVDLAGVLVRDLTWSGGDEARNRLVTLAPAGSVVTLHSVRLDPITGHTLGIILNGSGANVAVELVRAGYATVWDGKGPRTLPAWPPVPARVTTRRRLAS